MATLDEIRRWARGANVKGLPKRKRREKGPKFFPCVYKITPSGDDALLLTGSFRGRRISEMLRSPRGKRYLKWLLRQNAPDDLESVIREHLEERIVFEGFV